jgi:DNA-directed RNA polymerase subunit D
MDIETLEETDEHIKFVLNNASPAFANALRRTMIAKVPTMAVTEVDFINNTSGLFDEVLAHRIGLIPWRFDREHYEMQGEDDEAEPTNQVELVLTKEGETKVTADDFQPTDTSVEPVNPGIPIVELLEGQELELEARAELGVGKDHAKYQAANASYIYYPVVTVNGTEVENAEEAVRVAPEKVKDADGPVEADSDIVYAMEETIDIEEGDEIEVVEHDDTFIFSVESVSGYTARELLITAADILEDELDEFEDATAAAL